MTVSVLVVDDHAMFRKGLRLMLDEEDDIEVVGEAGDGEEAMQRAAELSPNVIIMDITMPNVDGIEATRKIVADQPGAKVIALSIHSGKRFVQKILRAGAAGYILKECAPEELVHAVRAVAGDKAYLSSAISGIVVSEYVQLLKKSDEQVDDGQLSQSESLLLKLDAERTSILGTKFHRPVVPPDFVSRDRLLAKLDEACDLPLLLVCAPAGYGKSTLIVDWLETRDEPVAWLSLDESDSELDVFMGYVLSAVQTCFPNACRATAEMLEAPTLPPMSTLADSLINDLDVIEARFVLLLDDYQNIDNTAVHELLTKLCRHPPGNLQLVIITRRDPPLPLATMRASGQMGEVRLRDLQFTENETAQLVQHATGLELSPSALENLHAQMEGWVVGLQLVIQTVMHRKDPEDFLLKLSGNIREVQEYLLDQVVSQQPEHFQTCLVRLSVVDRFSRGFCDAVCPLSDSCTQAGGGMMDQIRRSGLFAVPLDDSGHWYRFHHLIRELLQNRLHREFGGDGVAELNNQAGEWFATQGSIELAIKHFLAANNPTRAAELVEQNWHDELDRDSWMVVQRWLSLLPADAAQQRPRILLAKAWMLHEQWRVFEMISIVEQVESLIEVEPEDAELLGELNLIKGIICFWQGETAECRKCLESAQSHIPDSWTCLTGEVEIYRGLALQRECSHDTAIKSIEERILATDSSNGMLLSRLTAALSFIHLLSGDLVNAANAVERMHNVTTKNDIAYSHAWANYLRACCALQSFDLESAQTHFESSAQKRYILHIRCAIDILAGMALTYQLSGQSDAASESMWQLLQFAQDTNDAEQMAVAYSFQARLALLQNDLASATRWAKSIDHENHAPAMFIWLEQPVVTRARVLIAAESNGDLPQTVELLAGLLNETRQLHNASQTIELVVLQAVALHKLERFDESRAALEEVLNLSEPGGWVRPFVESGPVMRSMLVALNDESPTAWQGELIGAFVSEAPEAPAPSPSRKVELHDPLTTREEEILELLTQRLSNKEIAARLFVTNETIKSHLKHIYQKLHVSSRREAVAKAAELGIFGNR